MATASPGNDQSTHHLVLTSGSTSIGLQIVNSGGDPDPLAFSREDIPGQSLRVYSGSMKHHDRDVPFEPIAQTDWSGGRGSDDFDEDASKYGDGGGIDTTKSARVIMGGFASYWGPTSATSQAWTFKNADGTGVTYLGQQLTAANPQIAVTFTPGATYTPSYVYLYVRRTGWIMGIPKVYIRATVDGANIYTSSMATPMDNPMYGAWTPMRISLSGAGALTSGVTYFLVIGEENSASNYEVLLGSGTTTLRSKDSLGVWTSTADYPCPYYRIAAWAAPYKGHFFEYKGNIFAAFRYATGSVGKVFMNGEQGVATGAQTSTTLKDTSKTWTVNEWTGCVLRINKGTGSDQARPWRVISSNTVDTLTVDGAWDITPAAASTEYSIIASDKWTEITGHGWVAQVVTDVLSINGCVYIAHGDSTALTRMIRYNNAGTWTTTWATETGQFTFLKFAADQNGAFIWGAKGGTPATIAKAPVSDWTAGTGGANLTFGTAIGVGDLNDRITALERYTDYGNLHILKTSGIYQVIDDKPYLYQARALENSADYRNGRAVLAYDTFLYFSWHNSLIRYYRGMMDRIGPDREPVPLPGAAWGEHGRQGFIFALTGYSNLIIAAIDAGQNGYSSIMAYNGQGWCEMFRAPAPGLRIWSLKVQTIDGDAVDRLWFTCGSDMQWIPLSIDPYYHPYTAHNFYPFAPGGYLTTGWLYNELDEVTKYWNSVEYQSTLADYYGSIDVLYSTTGETFDYYLGASTQSTHEFTMTGVASKRLKVLFAIENFYSAYTPVIKTTIVEAIKRLPKAYADTMLVRLADDDVDLLGNPDDHSPNTAVGKYNTLSTLEEAALPVTITSMVSSLNNKSAFLEVNNQRPYRVQLADGKEAYLCQLMLIEVG